jgi:hypothetical protein
VTVEDGFEQLGRMGSDVNSSYGYWSYYYNAYTRGVFIGDSVYAVTPREVKAAPLAGPDTLSGSLTLP